MQCTKYGFSDESLLRVPLIGRNSLPLIQTLFYRYERALATGKVVLHVFVSIGNTFTMTGLKLILDPSPLNALVITSSWHWAKKSNTSVLLVLVATINYPHHLDHHPPDYGRGSQQEEGLEGPPSTSKVTRNHLVGQPRGQFSHLMHDVGLLCLKLNYLSRACGWIKHQFLISIHPSITNSSILPFIFL